MRCGQPQAYQGVGHDLEALAVVHDQEIALTKVAKLCIKVRGHTFLVAEKQGLDGETGSACSDTVFQHRPDQLVEDRAEKHLLNLIW